MKKEYPENPAVPALAATIKQHRNHQRPQEIAIHFVAAALDAERQITGESTGKFTLDNVETFIFAQVMTAMGNGHSAEVINEIFEACNIGAAKAIKAAKKRFG